MDCKIIKDLLKEINFKVVRNKDEYLLKDLDNPKNLLLHNKKIKNLDELCYLLRHHIKTFILEDGDSERYRDYINFSKSIYKGSLDDLLHKEE